MKKKKRDFKENPKNILSAKRAMKKFVDYLNQAKIFNEKIPYLVIHQKDKRMSSNLELELTFKDNINYNGNETIFNYIIEKLNNVSNYEIAFKYNEIIASITDKTNKKCYFNYLVAFSVLNFDKKCNKIKLIIQMYNNSIPDFCFIGVNN